jgi:hypothetical protein
MPIWIDEASFALQGESGKGGFQNDRESFCQRRRAIAKHKEAPLLNEREDYLRHLTTDQMCRTSIQGTATILMDVIRVLNLTSLRRVDMNEIRLAAECWAEEELVHREHLGCKTSARRFIRAAVFR